MAISFVSRKISTGSATPVTPQNLSLLDKLFVSTPRPITLNFSPQRESTEVPSSSCEGLGSRSIAANADLGGKVSRNNKGKIL